MKKKFIVLFFATLMLFGCENINETSVLTY